MQTANAEIVQCLTKSCLLKIDVFVHKFPLSMYVGVGEMSYQLKALTALPENPSLSSNN